MTSSTCLLLGATGLIGTSLLDLLLEDPGYRSVTVLTRRPLGRAHPKLIEVVCSLDRPETYQEHVAVDDVFCCLGTTMKKAGSREAFRKVDLEYPVSVARLASSAGASQYLIVTAVGADPSSSLFYNRTKGEVEAALRALPFASGVKIFRPSMLLGDRSEARPLERATAAFMSATGSLFAGPLRRYRAISGADVARAMHRAAREEPHSTRIYEGATLFALV